MIVNEKHQVMDSFPITLPTAQERIKKNNDDDHDEENQSNDTQINMTTIDLSSLLLPITNKRSDPKKDEVETRPKICLDTDCSICLGSIAPGCKVSRSSFDHCPHTFHQNCIVNWLTTLAYDHIVENDIWKEDYDDIDDYLSNVTLTCPVCRQEFLK